MWASTGRNGSTSPSHGAARIWSRLRRLPSRRISSNGVVVSDTVGSPAPTTHSRSPAREAQRAGRRPVRRRGRARPSATITSRLAQHARRVALARASERAAQVVLVGDGVVDEPAERVGQLAHQRLERRARRRPTRRAARRRCGRPGRRPGGRPTAGCRPCGGLSRATSAAGTPTRWAHRSCTVQSGHDGTTVAARRRRRGRPAARGRWRGRPRTRRRSQVRAWPHPGTGRPTGPRWRVSVVSRRWGATVARQRRDCSPQRVDTREATTWRGTSPPTRSSRRSSTGSSSSARRRSSRSTTSSRTRSGRPTRW